MLRCAVCIGVVAIAGSAQAASLSPGHYLVVSYYESATATSGATCQITPGTYLTSIYTYPGPGKSGAVSRTSLNGAEGNYYILNVFPTTATASSGTASGSLTQTIKPGGKPYQVSFTSTYQVVDDYTLLATTTYVVPSGSGTCTTVVQEQSIYSGK